MIQFGPAESVGRVALRGALGGTSQYVAPRFGTGCVCCNDDAQGRTQDYDPSIDRITADSFPVPVCFACRKHALRTHTAQILIVSLLGIGVAATFLGYTKLDERPEDHFLWWMIAIGISAIVAGVAWVLRAQVRERRLRGAGHHAGLTFSVDHGRTVLRTSNETLASELLELNPHAERRWTRAEKRHVPRAKAMDR